MSMSIQTELAVLALSQTLRSARLKHGESQATAAQRVGVGLRSYQRMESSTPEEAGRVAVGDVLMALGVYGIDVVQAITSAASVLAAAPSAKVVRPTKREPPRYGHSFRAQPARFLPNM
jgi:transcriptional regulator with XRE-family HTH domain